MLHSLRISSTLFTNLLASGRNLTRLSSRFQSSASLPTNKTFAPMSTDAEKKAIITASIREIPDWPKPGINFKDITTLLLDPKAFQLTIDLFVERYRGQNVTHIAGFEARGFIFGPPIALALGLPFVPLRKPKKLPGETIGEDYALEYGTDRIEMHVGAVNKGDRVVLVDDLIATGGTLAAGIRLMERVGAEVVETACVIELPDLHGRSKLQGKPLFVLIEMHGE